VTSSTLGDKVPDYVLDEVDTIIDRTKKNHKEETITFCKKPDRERIYVGGYAPGRGADVEVGSCNAQFGESTQVGSVHTHPADDKGPGVLPSPPDVSINMEESFLQGQPQTDCIANHKAPYMVCYTPKQVPTREKVNAYNRAVARTRDSRRSDPYFHDHVRSDFDFSYYDVKKGLLKGEMGKRVADPDPKKLVQSVIGEGRTWIKKKVDDMSLGGYCQYIQDLSAPNDDRVAEECKRHLKTKRFLGITY
jgi:hypothetical protein